jgi:hypothetical protein
MNSFPHCNFYCGVEVVVSCLSMMHVNVEGPLNILMLVKKKIEIIFFHFLGFGLLSSWLLIHFCYVFKLEIFIPH